MSSSRLLDSPGAPDEAKASHYGASAPAINDVPARAAPPLDKDKMTLRQRVHHLVEGNVDSWFEYLILFLIFANVILFLLGTVPYHTPKQNYYSPDEKNPACMVSGSNYNNQFPHFFDVCEIISIVIFTLEYLLRMWSCVEAPDVKDSCSGRLSYGLRFFSIVDFVSIVPFYITMIPGIPDASFTTAIRGFRLIRVLKADKYVAAFALLWKVIRDNGSLLVATLFYALVCLLVFSTILYFTERHNMDPQLECHFSSAPAAMFPTLLMLTGEYPLSSFSPAGQFFSAIIATVAVAIFAVPTGVLGSGFIKAVQEAQGKEFTVDA